MFFIVIPQCLLINEELQGYILINNTKIMIENYSFFINGYLFYQINEILKDYKYYINNYNEFRKFSSFNNILKINNHKEIIYSNNIIKITQNIDEPYFLTIEGIQQTYLCKKLYFNINKEFIIEEKSQTLSSFTCEYLLSI